MDLGKHVTNKNLPVFFKSVKTSQEGGFICSQVWKGWGPQCGWMITSDWWMNRMSNYHFKWLVQNCVSYPTKLVQGERSAIHPERNCEVSWILMLWNGFRVDRYWHPAIYFGKLENSNRICFEVRNLWNKLHWTKHCPLLNKAGMLKIPAMRNSLGTKRVLVVFVLAGQVRITRVYKSMKSMQTILLKILHHVPVVSFRPVFWILKLLCGEDDLRQAIWTGWTTKSVSWACNFSGRKQRMKMRVKPGSQKPTRPKVLLQSFSGGFLPGAISTLFHNESIPITGPDFSFAWFRTQFPIFKVVLHIKDFSLRFLPEILVLLHSRLSGCFGWAPQWQLLITFNCRLPCLWGQWSLLSSFGCLYPGGCHRGTHESWQGTLRGDRTLIYDRSAGSTGDIHRGRGIQPAHVSRTVWLYSVSSRFLWLLQNSCTATRALACQGFTVSCTYWKWSKPTDHPNKNLSTSKAGRKIQISNLMPHAEGKRILLKSLLK